MRRVALLLSAFLVLVLVASPARAQTPTEAALEEIWAIEAKIYAGRAAGTMQPYVEAASKDMLTFPFNAVDPSDYDDFVESSKLFTGNQERNRVYLKGFYLTGGNSTAVIFYRAHRTMRPDGTVVDEYWDTSHIYARESGGWKMLSSINRAANSKDISSTRPPIDPRR
jgi:ABC-type phosphate/phosphonate transport system substrate-binding protein